MIDEIDEERFNYDTVKIKIFGNDISARKKSSVFLTTMHSEMLSQQKFMSYGNVSQEKFEFDDTRMNESGEDVLLSAS